MKARSFILMGILLLVVSSLFASDIERCYGTWANPKYDENYMKYSKYVIKSDGTFEKYLSTSDKNPIVEGPFTVKASWTDSEGNFYFQMYTADLESAFPGHSIETGYYYYLWKLSNTGETLEQQYTTWDYPTEFDTDSFYYHIFYRQE